jgi:hypothetical protein
VPTEPPTPEPEFSQEQIDYLYGLVQTDASAYGWAAGCLWLEELDSADLPPEFTPYNLLRLSKHVSSGTYGEAPASGKQPARVGTVYEGSLTYDGPPATTFELVDGEGFVCYRPK